MNNGQVIFVVASSGTAIVSEQLVKVSANGTNVFTPTTIADVAIVGVGDSTTRTFSWVGPQTDALVDDAGILMPGGTAIHSIKWDDTTNLFKFNDSTMIDSTYQFVFPKGNNTATTSGGHKPDASGGTAGTAYPIATPGAMRFNTTNAKFEGVHGGTAFDNLSSEPFATAMAIALG